MTSSLFLRHRALSHADVYEKTEHTYIDLIAVQSDIDMLMKMAKTK